MLSLDDRKEVAAKLINDLKKAIQWGRYDDAHDILRCIVMLHDVLSNIEKENE